MTTHNEPPKPPSDRNDRVQVVELGDLLANDHQLHSSLDRIADGIDRDSQGASSYFLHELLQWCKSLPFGITAVVKKSAQFVIEAVKRFSNCEARRILADAEAERIRVTAAAAAAKLYAEAERIRAEAVQIVYAAETQLKQGLAVAEKIVAETEEERAVTSRRDELVRILKRRGVEWITGREGDVLHIAVTKNKDTHQDSAK